MYINSQTNALPIIKAMMTLQANANNAGKPDWLTNPPPYLRAAYVESGECMDWLNFKWWKGGDANMPEAIIEMIDILHFYLSQEIINQNGDMDLAAKFVVGQLSNFSPAGSFMFDGLNYSFTDLDILRKVELLGGLATVRRTEWGLFASIMTEMNVDFDELYRLYTGKNSLNLLRSRHGYKNGTYVKIWDDGEEDNVHLNRFMETLPLDGQLYEKISTLMEDYYVNNVKKP